jgi:phosphoribosylformylglycinamidine synthase
MVGKGAAVNWRSPSDGCELALVGTTGAHVGGSVLDAVYGCGGAAPEKADPAVVIAIREKVRSGKFEGVTDLSQGGLLDALAKLAPQSSVKLSGDPLQALFSETCGRFLVSFRNESSLAGLDYVVIGEVGGDALNIAAGTARLTITRHEIKTALSSLTRLMRSSLE